MAEGSDLIFANGSLDGKNELHGYTVGSCHPFPEAVRTLFRPNKRLYIGLLEEADKPVLSESYQRAVSTGNDFSGGTCGNHARLLGRTALWRHILYHRKGADAEQKHYKPL